MDTPPVLRGRTAATLTWLAAFAAVPHVAALPWAGRASEPPVAAAVVVEHAVTAPAPFARPGQDVEGVAALHRVFAALRNGERVRVSHYGDSPITGDLITRTLRRGLQERFGDGGAGFVLFGRPWPWYARDGVRQVARGWRATPLFLGRGDGLVGFGGASFDTAGEAVSRFGTDGRVAAFDVAYLAQPGGGLLELELDGVPLPPIDTSAAEAHPALHRVRVAAGPHVLAARAVGSVRAYGVSLESDQIGVVYDALGLNGAFIGLFAHQMDRAHWAAVLQQMHPHLVVLNFGANESQFETWPMDRYEADTREVVARLRAALPDVAILFLAPMDRAVRGPDGLVTRRTIPRLVDAQRRLAAETGCAFFDTYAAMGGEGTAARWYAARPRLMSGDLTHPTVAGSEVVGGRVRDALLRAYDHWRVAPPRASQDAGPMWPEKE